MAVLGLCCCAGFSLVEMSRGYSTDAMLRLLIAVVSLVAKHGLQGALASVVVASRLQNTGSIVVAKGLSCSMACGIFPDQGLNLCLPYWQADSLPLNHQGSPISWSLSIHLKYIHFLGEGRGWMVEDEFRRGLSGCLERPEAKPGAYEFE